MGRTWDEATQMFDNWLTINPSHVHFQNMQDFKDGGYDRKNFSLKEIRNDIMGIFGISKPWEIVAGQAIAPLKWQIGTDFNKEGSMFSYLGEKTVKNIIPKE